MTAAPALSVDMPTGLRNKIAIRLLPLLCLMYLLNIMDRMNVGYARNKMEADLQMASWVFSWGTGIFYFGYFFFEVPANLILPRVGARRWMARIMITWGLVSCATALVTGAWSFFGIRILLGVAEAGFFPGIVLYLTFWFPARERGKAMALFMTGTAISGIVANPISGVIMDRMPGVLGLSGWQWLFILEGLPSIFVGFLVYYFLTDSPGTASWMTDADRRELDERLQRENDYRQKHHGGDMFVALKDYRVWLLIIAYITVAVGTNTSAFNMAKMVKFRFSDHSETAMGLLVALPHCCALILMLIMGQFSDRTKLRRTAFAISATLGALGWVIIMLSMQPWPLTEAMVNKGTGVPFEVGGGADLVASRWLFLAGCGLAQAGMISMIPTFWVMPTSFLTGTAAAAGIALINSVGNLGGLVGAPIHDQLSHPSMIAILALGAAIVFLVRHDPTLDRGVSVSGGGGEK